LEAERIYRQLLVIEPRSAALHNNLGWALMEQQRFADATASFRAALLLWPQSAGIWTNLGSALHALRLLDDAADAYQQALDLNSKLPEALANLGHVQADKGNVIEAIRYFQAALALAPGMTHAWIGLGRACHAAGELDAAASAFGQALKLDQRNSELWQRFGNVLKDQGKIAEAMAHYRNAVDLSHDPQIAGHLTHASMFDPACDPVQLRIDLQAADALSRTIGRTPRSKRPHDRESENRRLRIGYLSADFREHVVGMNLLPLLSHHNRKEFEVTCYSVGEKHDDVTRKLNAAAERWRDMSDAPDASVTKQIVDDQIDILVDCSMHLAGNRFRVVAARPAAVQVAFAAYPGSAGTRAIDFRLSDPYLDPPGGDESINLEKIIRLPNTFSCYSPFTSQPEPGAPPAEHNTFITFGSLNNFAKVNDKVLSLWGRLLSTVAQSRLMLRCPAGSSRQRVLATMSNHGVEKRRIQFVGDQSREDYLKSYGRIDIALDPFPYNGHTTSLDALWMGVPVVSLAGQFPWSRAGLCQLSNLGLSHLCATSTDEYLEIARRLAEDELELRKLHISLRRRMEKSPLMDAPAFARHVEAAYRTMW
jgi:predicted O-linked N-acetylglucosamine transferase (SPINDLY family)